MRSRSRKIGIVIAAIVSLSSLRSLSAEGQRYCPIPCIHRMHQYDIGPCGHPCYGAYGMYPCHPAGDIYPCIHPVHAWDSIPC
jgi:hypothetical protein